MVNVVDQIVTSITKSETVYEKAKVRTFVDATY